MPTTRVRAHERVREGKHEHVRQHTRRVDGSSYVEELSPEDGETIEEQEVKETESKPGTGILEKKPENTKSGSTEKSEK